MNTDNHRMHICMRSIALFSMDADGHAHTPINNWKGHGYSGEVGGRLGAREREGSREGEKERERERERERESGRESRASWLQSRSDAAGEMTAMYFLLFHSPVLHQSDCDHPTSLQENPPLKMQWPPTLLGAWVQWRQTSHLPHGPQICHRLPPILPPISSPPFPPPSLSPFTHPLSPLFSSPYPSSSNLSSHLLASPPLLSPCSLLRSAIARKLPGRWCPASPWLCLPGGGRARGRAGGRAGRRTRKLPGQSGSQCAWEGWQRQQPERG